VRQGIPYVYSAAVSTHGLTFTVLPASAEGDLPWEAEGLATPCLRCIFEQAPPPGMTPTCDTAGVLGPVAAAVAVTAAAEVLKVLTGTWPAVRRDLLHIDLWENSFRSFHVERSQQCPCCELRRFDSLDGRSRSDTTGLCGRDAVQISPASVDQVVDLEHLAGRLEAHGPVTRNRFLLRACFESLGDPYELTLFRDGRAIIKGTRQPEVARRLYAKYVGG